MEMGLNSLDSALIWPQSNRIKQTSKTILWQNMTSLVSHGAKLAIKCANFDDDPIDTSLFIISKYLKSIYVL